MSRLSEIKNLLAKRPLSAGLLSAAFSFLFTASLSAVEPSVACLAVVKNTAQAVSEAQHRNCPIAAQVALWLQLRQGNFIGTFTQALDVFNSHPWPEKEALLQRIEAVIDEDTPDQEIFRWFTKHPPVSGAGATAYLDVLDRKGENAKLASLAPQYWITLNFQESEEAQFLARFSRHLKQSHHWQRAQRLLWDERADAALRLVAKLTTEQRNMVHARVALIRDLPGVESAINRVNGKNDEGLWYHRTRWRRMRNLENAPEYLLKNSAFKTEHAVLWAKERLILARRLLEEERFQEAYKLVAHHGTTSGIEFAEAEWLAGWIAIEYLGHPTKAFKHFSTMHKHVSTPLSRGRAAYWAARAADALKRPQDAKKWLKKAAKYPGHFYGQLALNILHGSHLPSLLRQIPLTAEEAQNFRSKNIDTIIHLLAKTDNESALKSYLENIAEALQTTGQRYALVKFLETHYPRFVVHTAKRIARFETFTVDAAYPLLKIPAHPMDADAALVHAIIRQESSFDPKATSPAGAMGLMQLMSSTAKEMAKKLGIKFAQKDLHNRPEYNIRLGQHYLKRLLESYQDSHALTLAAYNAGPGNVRQWLQHIGDPRNTQIDIIDWIERIPFSETRTYVQRVMENLVIYRQLLAQKKTSQKNTALRKL